jgi:hypothetical protein
MLSFVANIFAITAKEQFVCGSNGEVVCGKEGLAPCGCCQADATQNNSLKNFNPGMIFGGRTMLTILIQGNLKWA